jgi:hypothetical protein
MDRNQAFLSFCPIFGDQVLYATERFPVVGDKDAIQG